MAKMEKHLTKSELFANIAEATGLSRKQIASVFDALTDNMKKSIGKTGCGKFILPGLIKIEKRKVPARPARKGVPNPFKPGELMDVAAKPASTKIVVRALKALKEF